MTADRARTQYTICDDCGNPTLEHDKAVWTIDGASYCPTCRPVIDRAALVEKVAEMLSYWERPSIAAAIDLIRAEVLEEAARVADEYDGNGILWDNAAVACDEIAAAIRALKETK